MLIDDIDGHDQDGNPKAAQNNYIGGLISMHDPRNDMAAAIQLHNTLNDRNKWQFGMLEYIFDE